MTTIPSARTAADAVHGLLDAIPNLVVFRGHAGPLTLADDGTVPAYAVGYYGAGAPRVTRLDGRARNLAWSGQITCAGGDDVKALWAVDKVRAVLTNTRVTVDSRTGILRELGDPGPIREDRDVSPYRYYLPLDFGLYL